MPEPTAKTEKAAKSLDYEFDADAFQRFQLYRNAFGRILTK
jgi:hypothetical protein